MNINISKELHSALKKYCKANSLIISNFVETLIRQSFKSTDLEYQGHFGDSVCNYIEYQHSPDYMNGEFPTKILQYDNQIDKNLLGVVSYI